MSVGDLPQRDFETMPIGTARKLEQLEKLVRDSTSVEYLEQLYREVKRLRAELGHEKVAAERQCQELLEREGLSNKCALSCIFCAFFADDFLGLKEHSATCKEHPAVEGRHRAQLVRESLQELHRALATCPGFQGVATQQVWEALHDTYVAVSRRKP